MSNYSNIHKPSPKCQSQLKKNLCWPTAENPGSVCVYKVSHSSLLLLTEVLALTQTEYNSSALVCLPEEKVSYKATSLQTTNSAVCVLLLGPIISRSFTNFQRRSACYLTFSSFRVEVIKPK